MHRPAKWIRYGLFLAPWLPLYVLAAAVFTYFSPPRYVQTAVLELRPDGGSTFRAIQPSHPLVLERVTPALVILICLAVAFIVGCAFLVAGLLSRRGLPSKPSTSA